tara:strand:- start:2 stop:442 length:441 start_codon:yes stop_codon:yes gene_type:complete
VKSLKKKQRIQILLVSVVALILSVGLIGYAMRDGINFFRSPSQILADLPSSDEVFRVGGLVEKGSVLKNENGTLRFQVTDGINSITVFYKGILPDLFSEGQGMVATGIYKNDVFEASEILAKHDEKYMPKEVSNVLKKQGVYRYEN